MSSAAGPFFVVAALLGVAGVAKIRQPLPTAAAMRTAGLPGTLGLARALGVVEVLVALAALGFGGPSTALVVAAAYVGFASIAIRLVARPDGGSCGCFGAESAPMTNLHVGLNVAAALLAVAAAIWPTDGLPSLAVDDPFPTAVLVGMVAVGVALARAAFTSLPELLAVTRRSER